MNTVRAGAARRGSERDLLGSTRSGWASLGVGIGGDSSSVLGGNILTIKWVGRWRVVAGDARSRVWEGPSSRCGHSGEVAGYSCARCESVAVNFAILFLLVEHVLHEPLLDIIAMVALSHGMTGVARRWVTATQGGGGECATKGGNTFQVREAISCAQPVIVAIDEGEVMGLNLLHREWQR